MTAVQSVTGPQLRLRLIEVADADYVLGLRLNPKYNTHLSAVADSADDQRRWIEAYKSREAEGQEFYFIIERKDGTRCGTVRLYNITRDSFTWGSWILDHSKPRKAALESAVLSFGFGFECFRVEQANLDARRSNSVALAFYRRLGMINTHEDARDVFFVYPRSRFEADRAGYLEQLQQEARA